MKKDIDLIISKEDEAKYAQETEGSSLDFCLVESVINILMHIYLLSASIIFPFAFLLACMSIIQVSGILYVGVQIECHFIFMELAIILYKSYVLGSLSITFC